MILLLRKPFFLKAWLFSLTFCLLMTVSGGLVNARMQEPVKSQQSSEASGFCPNNQTLDTEEIYQKCIELFQTRQKFLDLKVKTHNLELKEKFQEMKLAEYGYIIADMKHTEAVYAWQLKASGYVLFLVFVLVVGGVALTAYQLHMSFKIGQPIGDQEITASAKELSVRASVVGITVLVISLAFTYLFLMEVYKINRNGDDTSNPAAEQPK